MEANNQDVLILEDLSTPQQNPVKNSNKKPSRRKKQKDPAKAKLKRLHDQQKQDKEYIVKNPSQLNYIYKLEYQLSESKQKMKRQKKVFKRFYHSLLQHFDKDGIEFETISKYIDDLAPEEDEIFYSQTLELLDYPKQKPKPVVKKKSGLGRGRPRKNIGLYKQNNLMGEVPMKYMKRENQFNEQQDPFNLYNAQTQQNIPNQIRRQYQNGYNQIQQHQSNQKVKPGQIFSIQRNGNQSSFNDAFPNPVPTMHTTSMSKEQKANLIQNIVDNYSPYKQQQPQFQ